MKDRWRTLPRWWRGSLEHKPVCVPLGMGVMGILEGQLDEQAIRFAALDDLGIARDNS